MVTQPSGCLPNAACTFIPMPLAIMQLAFVGAQQHAAAAHYSSSNFRTFAPHCVGSVAVFAVSQALSLKARSSHRCVTRVSSHLDCNREPQSLTNRIARPYSRTVPNLHAMQQKDFTHLFTMVSSLRMLHFPKGCMSCPLPVGSGEASVSPFFSSSSARPIEIPLLIVSPAYQSSHCGAPMDECSRPTDALSVGLFCQC